MDKVVTITRQGQLTIPRFLLRQFGITVSTKAIVRTEGNTIIVEPKNDFWSFKGALRSRVKLSDAKLRLARKAFTKHWARSV